MTAQAEVQKQRDADRTRAAILTAAVESFSESGYAGARVAAIAARANVPTGLIYHYFDSKRTLFEAALGSAFEPIAGDVQKLLASTEPTLEIMLEGVRQYFNLLRANPRLVRMIAWWYASLGWVESPVPASSIWAAKEAAVRFVARLIEQGAIDTSVDPESVVLSIMALCQHWHISFGENVHLLRPGANRDPHDVRLEQILEFTLRALRPVAA
jgi:AcrR family transcriptional regulator